MQSSNTWGKLLYGELKERPGQVVKHAWGFWSTQQKMQGSNYVAVSGKVETLDLISYHGTQPCWVPAMPASN